MTKDATNIPFAPVDYYSAPFSAEQIKLLNAKLNPDLVSERQGLSYLEAHTVIRHANQIFGFGNWERGEPKFTLINDIESTKDGTKKQYSCAYTCSLPIRIYSNVDGIRQVVCETWGTGFGDGINMPDRGKAHEFATKEA